MRAIWSAGLAVLLAGCTASESDSIRTLEASGFENIELHGFSLWTCNDYELSQSFRARNAKGKPVEGVVCCGVLKNCTVRF